MTRRNGLFVVLAALLCLVLLAGCSAQAEVEPEQPPVEQPGQDADVDLFLEEHPGYRALTEEERAQVSEYLRPYDEDSEGVVNSALLSGFVRRAYYADPTQINLDELLRYNPLCELVTDEAEYQALKQVEGWYRGEDATLANSLTPVWRYSGAAVDQLLQEYAGITRAELGEQSWKRLLYQPANDCYYNFTSDSGPGEFICVWGYTDGEWAVLYDDDCYDCVRELRLHKAEDGRWLFYSLLLVEEPDT